jgi:5-methylcytosine-specific restriction endonuclease McrA
MRDFIWDQVKGLSQLKKDLGKVCSIPGCGNPLTHMQGPGSDTLCRDHQLVQVEYGGVGKKARPHTFHREWTCSECGKDVSLAVEEKYPTLKETSPDIFNRLCRNRIIGDHIVRRADGGEDTKENIQSLCLDCNSDKTILNEDFKKGVK